ncbi:MAG: hypothetical protein HQK53_02905 [Oligoflexia bacterium]|nr:hypothetical protein [Oligoflexia bacterium]
MINLIINVSAKLKIKITSSNLSQVVTELNEFLGDVEGLKIVIRGGKVCVEGEIVVPSEIGRVSTVLEGYKDVIQLYELSPHTERIILEKMKDELKRAGLKDVTVRIVNRVYWIEGVVGKDSDRDLATRIVSGFVPDRITTLSQKSGKLNEIKGRGVIENFITVSEGAAAQQKQPPPAAKMIKIIAQFVELTKDYSKIFGFKWTPTMAQGGGGQIQFGKTTTDGVTTKSNGTFSGTLANLLPQLAAAKSAGHAREIQSGLIIVKDKAKEEVTVTKNTTIPFTLGTGEFSRVLQVKTGFSFKVKASIVGNDKIELGLGIGVSLGQGQSGTTENNIRTILIVNDKESAVVGGIALNESQTQYDKDPPFGQDKVEGAIPLFSFLRSKSHAISKSQFVVFVTPEIIDNASKASNEIKRKFRQRRR